MNAQKESLKKIFRGSHKLPQAHEKCARKIKSINKEKNDVYVKMLLMEGGSL